MCNRQASHTIQKRKASIVWKRKSNSVSLRRDGEEKAAEDKDSADGSQEELGSERENPRRQNGTGKITGSNPSVD